MVGISGLSVAGPLEGGKGICGYGYMLGFTHICTGVQKGTHQPFRSRHFYFYSQVHTLYFSLHSILRTYSLHSHRNVSHETCSPTF